MHSNVLKSFLFFSLVSISYEILSFVYSFFNHGIFPISSLWWMLQTSLWWMLRWPCSDSLSQMKDFCLSCWECYLDDSPQMSVPCGDWLVCWVCRLVCSLASSKATHPLQGSPGDIKVQPPHPMGDNSEGTAPLQMLPWRLHPNPISPFAHSCSFPYHSTGVGPKSSP